MKIMIHQHHRDLLSCESSENTGGVPFNIEMGKFDRKRVSCNLSDSPVWKMLLALHKYNSSCVVHISLELNVDEKNWDYPRWIHVRILGSDNKFEIYSSQGPMELGDITQANPEIDSEKAWEEFFRDKINTKKLSICDEIENLQNKANELITIRDTYF